MIYNILDYLEHAAEMMPQKTAFTDGESGLSFAELRHSARCAGSRLAETGAAGPVAVYMERGADMAAAFFGALYGGCFYVPLDDEMPANRINLILNSLKPACIICSRKTAEKARKLEHSARIFIYNEMIDSAPNDGLLAQTRQGVIDSDPAYVVFTSGSTGTPKGVAASHRAVINYIEGLSEILGVTEDTVFGNQVPLYVDACLKELICTVKHAASTFFIPKSLFMFPVKLIEYINTHGINTICWVSSCLSLVSGLGALDKHCPKTLRTIAFGSETLPRKHFDKWRKALPSALFINLYGPTEATGMSCYYIADGELEPDEPVPIGRPFPNTRVFLLDGEICISGSRLAIGYYNDPEKTAAAFIQNPLNTAYPERIYRTGDLGRYNSRGELVFVARADNQIKHMGYRIELTEIEAAADRANGVNQACCAHNSETGKITLFYTGTADEQAVTAHLREHLQRFMVPSVVRRLDEMPYSANMKIDRKKLGEML